MEDIKGLIEKIQREGVKEAADKAAEIEEEARKSSSDIMHKAKQEAEKILADARDASSRMHSTTLVSLKQAGRDLLLSLKKEINAILQKVIVKEVRHALGPEELSKIIIALIKQQARDEAHKPEVVLSKEDLKKLEGALLSKLKDEVKNGIVLKPSDDVLAGFAISYDGGKSYFDFTDKALAEYISAYLKPQLSEILK